MNNGQFVPPQQPVTTTQQQVPQQQSVFQPGQAPAVQQPLQAAPHPHATVYVPPVQPPPVLGAGGLGATPEQILQDAYQNQQNAGLVHPQQGPAVQYTPTTPNQVVNGQVVQTSAPQTTVVHGAPPQQQQYQQPAPPPAEDYGVDTAPYEQHMSEDMLQAVVQDAYDSGVPQEHLDAHVQQAIESGMGAFENPQHMMDYSQATDNFRGYLAQTYGANNVDAVLGEVEQNIRNVGGDAMVDRYMSDPSMLTPEMLNPYLPQGEGSNPWANQGRPSGQGYNPYQQYMQPRGQGMIGGGDPTHGGTGLTAEQVQGKISQMRQMPREQQNTNEWNTQMLQLMTAQEQLAQGQTIL